MAAPLRTGRLVLLSGRGEPEAQRCERLVQESGVDWTIVRASWFCQNFSEGYFLEPLLAGQVALPVGNVGEPFVDADDSRRWPSPPSRKIGTSARSTR